jgi:hypothetical protein
MFPYTASKKGFHHCHSTGNLAKPQSTQSSNRCFLGKISPGWLRVGGASPPPLITFTITSKVAAYAPAEWADTHTNPVSSLVKICTLWAKLCGLKTGLNKCVSGSARSGHPFSLLYLPSLAFLQGLICPGPASTQKKTRLYTPANRKACLPP